MLVPYTTETLSIIDDVFGFIKVNSTQAVSYTVYHSVKWSYPGKSYANDELAFWVSYLNWEDTAPGSDSWLNVLYRGPFSDVNG